jgi:(p)ppGpp synthase/HD superfamily hydrolase
MPSYNLEAAIALACEAHRGQTDKSGEPYILHLMRVMLSVDGELARVVAILHDLLEDTDYTPDKLRELGYKEDVIGLLDRVTRRQDEGYDEFIDRCGSAKISRIVKIADLDDHINFNARKLLSDEQVIRYQRSWHRLMRLEDRPHGCSRKRNDP